VGRRSPGDKIRVLVVDDHEGFRRALKSTFALEPDIEISGEAVDGYDALDAFGRLKPDLVLMDVNMPGMGGMAATRKLLDAYPDTPVIVLTMYKGEEHLREARRAGASAYVLKDAGSDALLQTIRAVMHGENPILQTDDDPAPELRVTSGELRVDETAKTQRPPGPDTSHLITSNERTILALLAEGLTNDEIANRTKVPVSMVRTYVDEICRKLGLPGREALVQYAQTHSLDRNGSETPESKP
jgi:DNA-binding NarL/FixJ family response regulator